MKRIVILLLSVLIVAFAIGGEWSTGSVNWSGSGSSSGLLNAATAASSSFQLAVEMEDKEDPNSASDGYKYPETLSIAWKSIEGANSDSTNVIFALEFSNDSTQWVPYGNVDTLLSTVAASAETVYGYQVITDMPQFKYGRVTATSATGAGDTLTVSSFYSLDYSNY